MADGQEVPIPDEEPGVEPLVVDPEAVLEEVGMEPMDPPEPTEPTGRPEREPETQRWPAELTRTVYCAPTPRAKPVAPAPDWEELRLELTRVARWLGHQLAGDALDISVVAARFGFFILVFATIVSGMGGEIRDVTTVGDFEPERRELEARVLVEEFLETGHLSQFQKAHTMLASSAQGQVSELELRRLFQSLPLGQSPEEWDTTFENNGVSATVVIRRGGAEETYLLLQEDQEWGLASVSVSQG